MLLDLNAKRAARAAQFGEPMSFQVNDNNFVLVPELPLAAIEMATASNIAGAMKVLLADPDDWERFMQTEPTINDVMDIVEFYGTSVGESSASSGSSKSGGGVSRLTSDGSTALTSVAPVTDPTPSASDASSP
jgi:hypothetical protein